MKILKLAIVAIFLFGGLTLGFSSYLTNGGNTPLPIGRAKIIAKVFGEYYGGRGAYYEFRQFLDPLSVKQIKISYSDDFGGSVHAGIFEVGPGGSTISGHEVIYAPSLGNYFETTYKRNGEIDSKDLTKEEAIRKIDSLLKEADLFRAIMRSLFKSIGSKK